MKQPIILFLMATICYVLACTTPVKEKSPVAANSFITASNALELDPRLVTADSLVFVFYKDPYMTDSLRYTRFYSQYASTDTMQVNQLLQNLAWKFKKQEKPRSCRNEGKIWCFAKGKVFQTIYFSTRCNGCCFLFLVKDGYFFYTDVKQSLVDMLKDLQLKAIPVKAEK